MMKLLPEEDAMEMYCDQANDGGDWLVSKIILIKWYNTYPKIMYSSSVILCNSS